MLLHELFWPTASLEATKLRKEGEMESEQIWTRETRMGKQKTFDRFTQTSASVYYRLRTLL